MAIRGERSDNVHENKEFTQTDAKKCWDEIPRTSIALTEKLLVPGQFGVIVVEGKVMKPLLDIVEPCSVKLFKGIYIYIYIYIYIQYVHIRFSKYIH